MRRTDVYAGLAIVVAVAWFVVFGAAWIVREFVL